MRIGLIVGTRGGIDDVIGEVRAAAEGGFQTVWMAQVNAWDSLTVLSVVGREVGGIELGTAVVPTYPRHPVSLAVQALTVQAVTGGRLVLGIGLSHRPVIEGTYGMSFERPAAHMKEYLSVLAPLIREGKSSFVGETITGLAQVNVEGSSAMPILLAALAPRMLKLAGSIADGTITWMTGPKTIASHIVPSINAAAKEADRPAPRVVCGLPICVTDDVAAASERATRGFVGYAALPSYRAVLDIEGVQGPGDVAIVGDEQAVASVLDRLAEGGATDFEAAVFGSSAERRRTIDFLAARAASA